MEMHFPHLTNGYTPHLQRRLSTSRRLTVAIVCTVFGCRGSCGRNVGGGGY